MVVAAFPPSEGALNRPPDTRLLVRRARLLCRRDGAFADEGEALVLVSGGQDSLALLHLLATGALGDDGPRSLRALHVNHHLRGADSDADESLVRDRCAALGVPLEVAHAPIRKGDGNVQAEARAARRGAARDSLARSGAATAVLGHTLDDQVETMLYRLGRYGGLGALAAMSPVDLPWVRPLLTSRRAETEAYCVAHGLEYAVDRGNEYPGYARTGLRGRVVPAWEEVLPGAVRSAGRAAEVASEAAEIVRSAVDEARLWVMVAANGVGLELSVARLLELPRALRRALLHSALETCLGREVSRSVVLEVEGLLAGGGSAEAAVGAGWTVRREYGRLLAAPGATHRSGPRGARRDGPGPESSATPEPVTLGVPGEARFGDLLVCAHPTEHFLAHDPRNEAYLDAAVLTGPLWARGPLPGDRMRPLGAPGRRLVQDILVDLKVPREARSRVPVLGCGERILWLAGCALAEEGRISSTTDRLIRLAVLPAGEDGDAGHGHGVNGE